MYLLVRLKKSVLVALLAAALSLGGALCLTAMAAEAQQVPLPVIMYHSVLKDKDRLGKYVISPAELEKDLQYLQAEGYTAVGERDLIEYVEKGTALPSKPILLTFDDGYYNNYLYAYPLAQKYNTKIVIAPIGYWSEEYSKGQTLSPYYSHCTWAQIAEMEDSGLVDFANHSYNLHKSDGARLGSRRVLGESAADYEALFQKDLKLLQAKLQEHTGRISQMYAYPFGAMSKETPRLVAELGFKIGLTCEERMNTLSRDPESLRLLGRFLRPQNKSVAAILT